MKKLLLGTVGSLCLGGLAFADPPVFPDNDGIDEAELASADAEVPNDKFGTNAESGVAFGRQVSDLAKGGGVADAVSGGASSASSASNASNASSAPGSSASASGVGGNGSGNGPPDGVGGGRI